MKALVVDDEKLIVKGLKFSLEQDGYEVDCAYDGQEAIDKARDKEYDIMLLDLMLPVFDGYQVCQQVREFSDVPIIMLTAKGEDMDKILGLEYGADDYITKPFNILEVKARIKAIIRRNRRKTPTVQEEPKVIVSGSMFAVVVVYFVVYFTCMDIHSFSVEGKDLSLFKWIYYFFIMLMGAYMRKNTYSHDKKIRFFVLAAMAVVLWGALRVIFLIYPAFLPLQFLTQFMVVIFVYAMMRFGMSMETEAKFRKLCQCHIVKMLSEITLEVYIVQMIVLPFCERLCFPVNIPVAYISVFAAAYVLHFIINSKQFFTKKKERNRKGE